MPRRAIAQLACVTFPLLSRAPMEGFKRCLDGFLGTWFRARVRLGYGRT